MIRYFLTFLLLCGLVALRTPRLPADEQAVAHGFLDKVYKDADGKEAKYVLFVPQDYDGMKPFPLLLFLHGSGESGSDGQKQVTTGIGPAIKKMEKTFPFLVILPQSQGKSWIAEKSDAKRALNILDEIEKTYKVDPKRVTLTGLSMGGIGTWSIAASFPERWAAIVPICGKGDPKNAEKLKDIPCWCFHGDADMTVPVDGSRKMIEALKAIGAEPKYTEYKGVGHNSWDRAYGTAELYTWIAAQSRK